jgi:porin
MVPVEIAWTPSFGPLAGTYKLGAWYDTSAAPDVYTSVNGQPIAISGLNPLRDSGRYGGYFSVMQQLTADPTGSDPKHGLFAFFNATFSDERTSVQDRQINGGLEFHGPFPSRLNDDVGIALGTTHINARVAAAQALANALGAGPGFTQTGELASEVFYAYQLTPAVNLRGSVQYVHNPGGYNDSGTYQDTLVLGVRATLTF